MEVGDYIQRNQIQCKEMLQEVLDKKNMAQV